MTKYPEKWVNEYKSKYDIDLNIDPTTRNNFAIRFASANGHIELVKLLLTDKRVDPTTSDNWAIQSASYKGHAEIVELLENDDRIGKDWRDWVKIGNM